MWKKLKASLKKIRARLFSKPKSRWRLICFLIMAVLLIIWLIFFLSARPWQLAKSFEALNNLEASYNRTSPCHETCLVKRLEYEAIIIPALKKNLPGLKEKMLEQIADPQIKVVYKRELLRLLGN